jgi:trehalose 6-phosphate synthase
VSPGGGQEIGPGNSDFVVVANRLPIDMERLPDGSTAWKRSPGGLVTALEPLLRRRRGAWIGWPGVPDADEDPIEQDDMFLCPVGLSSEDIADYYEGFSNATLWPLYHDLIVKPIYHREWWERYVAVNRRFAEATARAAAQGATVWVQDYQLQLVPKMLRMLRRDLTIGFFLHIPFPPVEIFMQMPWRTEIIEGLLGADLVGFHLPGGAQNFMILSRRLLGANTSRGTVGVRSRFGEINVGFRAVKVGAFPISIDSTSMDQQARTRAIRQRAREIRSELGHPRKILLGVDRLDYTKGIDVRLLAFSELLAEHRAKRDDTVLVQLATPSRERVESYIEMREDIERQVGHINGEYGEVGHPIVHYIHRPIPRDELIAFFVAADVMLVTPLRDGMNLVAKEYVACRSDLGGALVLSEFTGAAAELRQAYLANPHHLEGVKDAIEAALNQTPEEGRRRMRALRRQVLAHDVDRWARSFLEALAATGSDAAKSG